jgi:hypothetical protein
MIMQNEMKYNDNLHRKQILRRHFCFGRQPREVFFFLAARHLVNSNPKQVCKEMITHQWNAMYEMVYLKKATTDYMIMRNKKSSKLA